MPIDFPRPALTPVERSAGSLRAPVKQPFRESWNMLGQNFLAEALHFVLSSQKSVSVLQLQYRLMQQQFRLIHVRMTPLLRGLRSGPEALHHHGVLRSAASRSVLPAPFAAIGTGKHAPELRMAVGKRPGLPNSRNLPDLLRKGVQLMGVKDWRISSSATIVPSRIISAR